MESLSWRSSSFLFAVVLSFFASSARLTESVSFRSLACSLCSISCRFLAWIFTVRKYWERRINHSLHRSRSVLYLRSLPCLEFQLEFQTCFFHVYVPFLPPEQHRDLTAAVSWSRELWVLLPLAILGFPCPPPGVHLEKLYVLLCKLVIHLDNDWTYSVAMASQNGLWAFGKDCVRERGSFELPTESLLESVSL